MSVCEKELTISNTFGLHGRASALLVETAKRFKAEIRLVRDDMDADCKSILDVMSMACTKGTPVSIKASGEDAEEALAALAQLIADKFGEE
ncbi:MAG: HPr family phosphocarrier protein [Deltaproteobacteria bacterium]|nr:HPr family phosphocarrier protein [Deltaproteobacteria bacterium]